MSVKFELNEIVMCKSAAADAFGYLAKIQEIKEEGGKLRYEIHFKGWNSRYDIWVDEEEADKRIYKHTPELEAEHKRLFAESKGTVAKKKIPQTPAKNRDLDPPGSGRSSQGTARIPAGKDGDSRIVIPDKLSALLLDDNDMINRQGKLAKLPAAVTIDDILKQYNDTISSNLSEMAGNDELLVDYNCWQEERRRKQREIHEHYLELVLNKHFMSQTSQGIIDYFNILLGSQLLYGPEHSQYVQFCVNPPDTEKSPGVKVNNVATPELEDIKIIPSSIYGIPHLVRLFVNIGPMLESGNYGEKSLQLLTQNIMDFMVFLSKNVNTFYNIERDYEVAPTTTDDVMADTE